MRLRKSKNAAEEQIVSLLNEGYSILQELKAQHVARDKAQDSNAGEVRLVDSPASLFVVQFVGEISENVIKDIEGKVETLKSRGKPAHYCIINGQDTARVLHAYGKLPPRNTATSNHSDRRRRLS